MSEEKNNGNGALGARKRLVAMAVMFTVMLFSSSLILVFILNFELKKDHIADAASPLSEDMGADISVPSFTIEPYDMPSPDLTRQRRALVTAELNDLMSLATTHVETAGDDEVTWIYDKTTPRAIMAINFYAYIGRKGNTMWGRLRVGCILKDSLYADKIIVNVDGDNYAMNIQLNDLKHEPMDHIDSTYEYVDLPVEGHSFLLHHIGNARDVYVCFKNGERERHFQLSRDQIDAVGRIMRIIDLQTELDEDDRRRAFHSAAAIP